MKEFIYYNELFDCYKNLLTEKEKEYFEEYYNEDLSYGEIAENKKVSRSAIQKMVKTVLEKLDDYEKKLHLQKIKDNVNKSDSIEELRHKIEEYL